MHRLERRTLILRGKRNGAFGSDQYWFENARRTRISRRIRVLLRFGEPVLLVTPRWSRAQSFLDDLATDLLLGDPTVTARTLNLAPLKGLTAHQGWAWLAAAVAEFCQLSLEDGPAWQAVSRRGFRTVMGELFERAEGGRRRCLMIHSLEHLHIEALNDLIAVFDSHIERYGRSRCFNLLLAGSVDSPQFEVAGAKRLALPDFSEREAVEALVELHGPLEPHRLTSVVALIGGVPALIDGLGDEVSSLSEVVADQDRLWRVLGPLADEVRSAIDILMADSKLSARLDLLARRGPQPVAEGDFQLVRGGLVTQTTRLDRTQSAIRAPWFADLVLAS